MAIHERNKKYNKIKDIGEEMGVKTDLLEKDLNTVDKGIKVQKKKVLSPGQLKR